MLRVSKLNLLALTILIFFSCAPKKQLEWEAVPVTGTKASFDDQLGVLVAGKSGVLLEFTPLPYLKKTDDDSFGGTIVVFNNTRDYVTVPWETVDLSDSFGFFKKYRLGQKKRVAVVFPKENITIPSGNSQTFSFSMNKPDYESARDLAEHAIYSLILPFQYPGETESVLLEVPYSVRGMK